MSSDKKTGIPDERVSLKSMLVRLEAGRKTSGRTNVGPPVLPLEERLRRNAEFHAHVDRVLDLDVETWGLT